MKHLSVWLNANKISLHVQKPKLVTFKQKRKMLDHKIKIMLNKKRLYPTPSVKYLAVKIDQNLNWHHHINYLAAKLNRANALLIKIRNYVNPNVLRSIYFAMFYSHLNYASLIWAQNSNVIQQIIILQKKSHQNNIFSASKLSFKPFFFRKIIF